MVGNERQPIAEAQRLLERLRNFVKQGGPQVRANLRFYLRMCLKAQELREQGWQATIRGGEQRWVVVIKGNKSLAKPLRPTPHAQLRRFNSRRKASFIFCRN